MICARLAVAAAEAGLAAHLAAHSRRAAADMGHSPAVAAAHRAALVLTGVLLAALLAGLRVDAVALTTVILLPRAAAHGLTVALTIAARAILPAVAAVAGIICAGCLAVAARRLAVAGLTAALRRVATVALAVLLALLGTGLLAVLLRVALGLAAIFVAMIVAALAVTVFVVCHDCSCV